jgi:hypothetical protein
MVILLRHCRHSLALTDGRTVVVQQLSDLIRLLCNALGCSSAAAHQPVRSVLYLSDHVVKEDS